VVILLVLSNLLTGIKVNRFSRKEQKAYDRKYDSLHLLYIQKGEALKKEIAIRRKIFLFDSLKLVEYKELIKKDSILIKKLRNRKDYSKLPPSVNLSKLDSAYEAEH
jgi:hypothetical protein